MVKIIYLNLSVWDDSLQFCLFVCLFVYRPLQFFFLLFSNFSLADYTLKRENDFKSTLSSFPGHIISLTIPIHF